MSEWNLSVRLTGQGSDLARTLRGLSREANATSRNVNALRRDLARLRAETRTPVRLRLDVDAGHLRSDVRAAVDGAMAGQDTSVNLRVGNRTDFRREVQDAVRWAAWGHRIDVPLGLADSMSLRREVSAAVRWAQDGQTIRLRTDVDTSGLRGLRVPGGGSGGGNPLGINLGSLVPMATAVVPLIAGLAANLAPLPGMFGAAAVGAGAFGAAIAGQAEELGEFAEAEQAYADAVREHGRGSLEAAQAQLAYQQRLAEMPAETQRAAVAISTLKENFQGWSDDMAQFTMEPVTKGATLLGEVLPRLSPEVESFSTQMDRLMNVAGGGVASGAFDRIADDVARLTDSQLDAFTDQVIHLLRVISEGDADDGVIGQIVDYMRSNGPAAREAIGAIGDAIGTLAEGAAQAGPVMLTLVTAAANLVAALPPEVVAVILQAAAALKLLQLAGAGAAAAAAGFGRVRTSLLGLAAASTAAGGGLLGLRAAFLALGTAAKASVILAGIGALVYAVAQLSDIGEQAPPNVDRLTTALGKLGATGKVTGEAASAFGKDFGKLRDQIDKVLDPSVSDKVNNWGADITNGLLDASDSTEEFNKSMDAIDESLTSLVQGGKADLAKAALANMTEGMSPDQAAKFRSELDGFQSAMDDVAFEAELTAQSMGVFGKAASDVEAKLNAQKTAADGLRASILALNDVNRSAHDAEIAFEQGMDDLTASFKENGNTLDVHTEKGRANREAMSQAAAAQDEMIAAGLAAGESFESMSGKSDKLRESMLTLATQAFDGNRAKAVEYVNTLLGVPEDVKTQITLERQDAIAGLQSVQDAINATPDAHTVTVDTLNATAIAALEAVGLKTEQLPDGKTAVFTANGQSLGAISAVSDALTRLDGKTARTYTVHTNTVYENHIVNRSTGEARSRKKLRPGHMADGGVVDFYAEGGFSPRLGTENHVAQIAPAGAYRVWAERETGGESYIPLGLSKRTRSRAIAEETVKRLGGDPAGISWHADGSVTGWRYDPSTGSLYSPSDAGAAGRKTRKVKGKQVEYFDLGAVERKLKSASKATRAWNEDLERVAIRVGGDVAEALASMGEEGVKLADKMATGSTKYINEMAAALRGLQATAKASLTDYTRQLGTANKMNKEFADDLTRLAASGYGDLASQLAAQNDTAAQQLADAAVRDKGKAAKANAQARSANKALTAGEVQDLVAIIAAIRTKTTGIHDVAAVTGLGEDVIIAIANKAKSQISSSLGSRAGRFLSDLGKANRFQAYEDGGIRAGLYATRGGIVRFAEPSTGGEAYLPLGANKRSTALPVLHNVATRFGLGLTDARVGRTTIIRQDAPSIGSMTNHISGGGSPMETARLLENRVGRAVRRARRGGVAARAE